jgi:predicted RNA-binding Zn-ribbon protein involved in translation (DUF1610 family)
MRWDGKKLTWADRVSRPKILALYEGHVRGAIDEQLLDEIAFAFYERCRDILTVSAAASGRVECPGCGVTVFRPDNASVNKSISVECDECEWRMPWGDYQKTFRRKQLMGGGAVDVFQRYIDRYGAAKTTTEKILLVDWVIYQCHRSVAPGGAPNTYTRPVAVNLIEGSMTRILDLLEYLANAPGVGDQLSPHYADWRARVLTGVDNRERWITEK